MSRSPPSSTTNACFDVDARFLRVDLGDVRLAAELGGRKALTACFDLAAAPVSSGQLLLCSAVAATQFGPWTPLAVSDVVSLFDGAPFRWWVTGGVALELFAGRRWRNHDDLDVGVSRCDGSAVFAWLRAFDIHVAANGSLRPWGGEALHETGFENNLWVRRSEAEPWVLDVTIGAGDVDRWIYRRDPAISRRWSEAVLTTADGVPFLAPELQLLFKSKSRRPKDDLDAETVIADLDGTRRGWLREHLDATHGWQHLLRSDDARTRE